MFSNPTLPGLPTHAAMLLVLLPGAGPGQQPSGMPTRPATLALLQNLQQQVGAAIRVLRIDEASHPAVVHSFGGGGLPAFVLLRDGVELWRQQGLPEGEFMAEALLSRLRPAAALPVGTREPAT